MFPMFVTGVLTVTSIMAAIYLSYESVKEHSMKYATVAGILALTGVSAIHFLYQRVTYG